MKIQHLDNRMTLLPLAAWLPGDNDVRIESCSSAGALLCELIKISSGVMSQRFFSLLSVSII
jgi:hypothetical protein